MKEGLKSKELEDGDSRGEFISMDHFKFDWLLFGLKVLLVVFSGGLFGLFLLWHGKFTLHFEKQSPPSQSDKVSLVSLEGSWSISKVKTSPGGFRYFIYHGLRYIYDPNTGTFKLPPPWTATWTQQGMLQMEGGLREDALTPEWKIQEGNNYINVPMVPIFEDLSRELLNPNYIYIYLCCLLWFVDEYAVFAGIILVTSLLGAFWDIYQRRANRRHIKEMAKVSVAVRVRRDGGWKDVSSVELMPGDVVQVPQGGGWKAPCDFVLVKGSALVDESSLTGESIPVVKLKIGEHPHQLYNPDVDKKHTIYCGTTIINSRNAEDSDLEESSALLLVVRIGWKTAKGNLIRSILKTKEMEYSYEKEAQIFLGLLIIVGIVCFFVSLWMRKTFTPGAIFDTSNLLYALETISILVPPMLPTLFQIGLVTSAGILQNTFSVFTTDSSRIPLSGLIQVMCFDKTGTLTKDDLDMVGVLASQQTAGFSQLTNIRDLPECPLLLSLACCHQLTQIDTTLLNERDVPGVEIPSYSGPVVDVKIFGSTSYVYHDARGDLFSYVVDPKGRKTEILKRFEFDPAVQRMSVVVKTQDSEDRLMIFCKGSPELIKGCCDPTTIPKQYDKTIKKYSKDGCYIIAVAFNPNFKKKENFDGLTRHKVEKNLIFLGFVLLRNELKPDTKLAIQQLNKCGILPLVITGDNVFTAFYIAKQCDIISSKKNCFVGDVNESGSLEFIDPYTSKRRLNIENFEVIEESAYSYLIERSEAAIGLTSAAWEILQSKETSFFIDSVVIFARMKPLQKEAVVKKIAGSHYIVGMCGDGANDCAALSAAHCGVALSEAEASVVSPFTAKSLSISSVVDLIREAQGCLANSFSIFKFTIFYGMIETVLALISYNYGGNLSEYQFILLDFVLFLPAAFFLCRSATSSRISTHPPTAKIFGLSTLISLFGHLTISVLGLTTGLILLGQQYWYTPSVVISADAEARSDIPEVTVVWFLGCLSLPTAAISFNIGSHWRKSNYLNLGLMFFICISFAFIGAVWWIFPDWDQGVYSFFMLVHLPGDLRIKLLFVGIGMMLAQVLWEYFAIRTWCDEMEHKMTKSKKTHLSYNEDVDYVKMDQIIF